MYHFAGPHIQLVICSSHSGVSPPAVTKDPGQDAAKMAYDIMWLMTRHFYYRRGYDLEANITQGHSVHSAIRFSVEICYNDKVL